jgi:8-oxo-dGTP pyrophosphatase MutT (NUDIX family)
MGQALRQAAVIPVSDGRIWMVTSSSGKRWVIPKGMIDPGHTAGEAALIEAWEEAGLVGRLVNEPVGTYLYEKYGRTYLVTVFLLQVTDSAIDWPERNSRRREWLLPEAAIDRIEEPGLREIVEGIFRPSTMNVDQF